ncbi:MAG: CoA-binding protein [Syntrophales bacterium]|jgi:acyl-CoA synthetase (NDP forming)|nr:CoA-binding protein [Syntrophales bacterium]MDY0045091.1 CoA-binding protein [Syntrophales bacterium]
MSCVAEDLVSYENLERIFNPRSIAVVGVSTKGTGFASGIMVSLKAIGYEGTMYPVNPRGGSYLGFDIYRRIEDIPGEIDFAIIAVPASSVAEALESCRKKGAAGAEILSAGFSELGTEEGIALEREITEVARRGIRVIGPNCFGLYCPKSGITLLPGPDLSRKSGPVAFLSQSGGMSIDFAHLGKWMGVMFSKVISFGNGADLRETELLDYLCNDPETGVISMYTEGVNDGEAFFEALAKTALIKPVVIYKGGLSKAGSRAVASHTASMGGNKVIWESVLRQCNAVQVRSLPELAQTSLAFARIPEGTYNRITVMGGGGALGIAACDAAERMNITIPRLKEEISESILALLPKPGSSALNPIDVANPHVPPQVLKEVLLKAAEDDSVDLQIMIQLFYHYKVLSSALGVPVKEVTPYRELADAVADVVRATRKPVVLVMPNNKQDANSLDVEEMRRDARAAFLEKGVPVFDELDDALRAITHVSKYYARRGVLTGIKSR